MKASSAVTNGKTEPAPRISWHAMDASAALARLDSDGRSGLASEEVERRLKRYGPNSFAATRTPPWYAILLRQFLSVLILILVAAAAISFAVGETVDAAAILAIIVLNGALGFFQEWKAEEALESLRRMLAPRSRVMRGGEEREIESRVLVPGDIVLLETGDRVPADLRLLDAIRLRADQSLLTGESASVSKQAAPVAEEQPVAERSSMAWMGTNVTGGSARGVVVATGESTEFGRIAHLTEALTEEATPLQKRLAGLGRQVGLLAVFVAAVVGLSGWLLGKPLIDMFLTGISLAVAVVPEGLPAVVTIALGLGARTMARKRALLRRLQAAETLGAATVICTDKTGTLTQNEMTVKAIWLPGAGNIEVGGDGYAPIGDFRREGAPLGNPVPPDLLSLLESGLRCNHARIYSDGGLWRHLGEPTEAALVVAAAKAGLSTEPSPAVVTEFPFDSDRKRMTVIERKAGALIAHVKGAPEIVLERSTEMFDGLGARPITPADRARILAARDAMAREGLRVLAIARRRLPPDVAPAVKLEADAVERELTFLGLAGMIDPPRPEVPESVRRAQAASIKIIVMTGDAAATAAEVARRIGLRVDRTITGAELARIGEADLKAALAGNVLFARISPEDKIGIVSALQQLGHIVCMTGDGVNDAPALKKADIGVAMGLRGTDVAKDASDLVLTDDNFASIVGAIEEGRRQWDNIQKFVRYLLSSNMGEVVAIFFNTLLGGPLILLPVQILWINLVTDGVSALALAVEPADREILLRPPRSAREPVVGWAGFATILSLGGYLGFGALWLFHHYLGGRMGGPAAASTMAFCGLVIMEEVNVFNFRSQGEPLSVIGYGTNRFLLAAFAATLALQIATIYVPFFQRVLHTTPLSIEDWGYIAAFSLPVIVVPELIKWVRWRRAPARAAV
ncbi:MAG TPA: cation-translocating P-type ATPase [Candidatus Dormibacteraeota bacterium]|nr:cation-translocating P-type ATPase [Candidatus Dormibacteraeota bacterium]